MEGAVVGRYQGVAIEKSSFNLFEVLRITAFAGSHADVVHGPPMTREYVVKASVDDCFFIDVIGVVGADLNGFVRGLVELWKLGVVKFYVPLEGCTRNSR